MYQWYGCSCAHHKAYGETEIHFHSFLTWAQGGGGWLASRPGSIIPGNKSGFGGLEVPCWPLVPTFAGSNPTEAVGFFRAKKSSARLPSEGK